MSGVISGPEQLSEQHDVASFSCGHTALDRWLQTRALSNQQKGFTAVMVVHVDLRVVGFYGLSPTAVLAAQLPRSIRTGQPPHPVPCLLLGQLATDLSWAGQGVGTGLVKQALQRSVAASQIVGGRALVVHAVDAAAAAFWLRRGFVPSHGDSCVLFRSMADIAASLAAAEVPKAG